MAVRIGEMLVREQLITPQQLQEAVRHQQADGGRVGQILVQLGYVRDEDITGLLSRQYGVPAVDLGQVEIDERVLRLIPAATARRHRVVPLHRTADTLTIAMSDPTTVLVMDDIRFMTGCDLETAVASESAIAEALDRHYPVTGRAGDAWVGSLAIATRELADLPWVGEDDLEILEDADAPDVVTLERQGGEAPVIRLVNVVLMSAISKGASDIHIEPYEKEYRIRYRVDGILYNIMSPPMKFRDAIASRVKCTRTSSPGGTVPGSAGT